MGKRHFLAHLITRSLRQGIIALMCAWMPDPMFDVASASTERVRALAQPASWGVFTCSQQLKRPPENLSLPASPLSYPLAFKMIYEDGFARMESWMLLIHTALWG